MAPHRKRGRNAAASSRTRQPAPCREVDPVYRRGELDEGRRPHWVQGRRLRRIRGPVLVERSEASPRARGSKRRGRPCTASRSAAARSSQAEAGWQAGDVAVEVALHGQAGALRVGEERGRPTAWREAGSGTWRAPWRLVALAIRAVVTIPALVTTPGTWAANRARGGRGSCPCC